MARSSQGAWAQPWHCVVLVLAAISCFSQLPVQAGQSDPKQPTAKQVAGPLPPVPSSCSLKLRQKINWGVATSAYQIEGAWNEDGKSMSIWDDFVRQPGKIFNNETGDVADDHYHRYKEDVQLIKKLGAKNYRLSLAWTRIVPGGVQGSPVNMKGIGFYKKLILELKANGITPALTLYHWDLPNILQEKYGGFLNKQFQDDFVYYADAVFKHLGPFVQNWMTFNEPLSICQLGYADAVFAPGLKGGPAGQFACGHNLLLAHAKTYQLYRMKYADKQGGRISMALDGKWGIPYDPNSAADIQAAEYWMQFQYGWMADPLYFGDYPAIMRKSQGAALPTFTAEESQMLKGTMDYFAVNFYCAYFIRAPPADNKDPTMVYNMTFVGPNGEPPGVPSNAFWLFKTPTAFRKTLVWIHKRYSGPEIWITENGVSGPDEESKPLPAVLEDTFRQDYYSTYLDNMCAAAAEDGVNIHTYFAWSLLDNFEWRDAFSKRFGIVYVDLNDNLKRYPKLTARWLSKWFFTAQSQVESAAVVTATAEGQPTNFVHKVFGKLFGNVFNG